MNRAGRRAPARLAAAGLLALAACTGTPSPVPGPSGTTGDVLTGTVLAEADQGRSVVTLRLPDGEPVPLRLPADVDFIPVAVPAEGGAVAVVFSRDRSTVYRLSADADPRPLLPFRGFVGRGGFGELTSIAVVGDRVVVGDCEAGVLLMRTIDGRGPARRVGEGCVGTLSPDGAHAAYFRDGAIWRVPVDGSSPPVELFRLDAVPGLRALVRLRDRAVFEMTWGEPGLALTIGDGETAAVVVAPTRGRLRAISPLGALFVSFLRWQPGGRLLGVGTGQSGTEGFIRLYDPDRDELRTIGLHPRGYLSAAWAPDGQHVLAVLGAGLFGSTGGYWAVLDLEGRQVHRMRGPAGVVFGWLP